MPEPMRTGARRHRRRGRLENARGDGGRRPGSGHLSHKVSSPSLDTADRRYAEEEWTVTRLSPTQCDDRKDGER
ncbi:hypothetical protein BN12_710010 [Nostocoides japonicum T1-X7]|uniref:Uncharacterized protein n=1 Tax=Nostocoides japonicum T1-X7 TaxID=1194083 RepID=A0A077M7C7_9MICO|nr:hypothetical protein BN12_710010 [Tetrasphaera japonica T1-X7]